MIAYTTVKESGIHERETFFSLKNLEICMTGKSLSVRNDIWYLPKSSIKVSVKPRCRSFGE